MDLLTLPAPGHGLVVGLAFSPLLALAVGLFRPRWSRGAALATSGALAAALLALATRGAPGWVDALGPVTLSLMPQPALALASLAAAVALLIWTGAVPSGLGLVGLWLGALGLTSVSVPLGTALLGLGLLPLTLVVGGRSPFLALPSALLLLAVAALPLLSPLGGSLKLAHQLAAAGALLGAALWGAWVAWRSPFLARALTALVAWVQLSIVVGELPDAWRYLAPFGGWLALGLAGGAVAARLSGRVPYGMAWSAMVVLGLSSGTTRGALGVGVLMAAFPLWVAGEAGGGRMQRALALGPALMGGGLVLYASATAVGPLASPLLAGPVALLAAAAVGWTPKPAPGAAWGWGWGLGVLLLAAWPWVPGAWSSAERVAARAERVRLPAGDVWGYRRLSRVSTPRPEAPDAGP